MKRAILNLEGQRPLFPEPGRIGRDPTIEQVRRRIQDLPFRPLSLDERDDLQRTITSRLPIGEDEYEHPEDVPEDEEELELEIVSEMADRELLEAAYRSLVA